MGRTVNKVCTGNTNILLESRFLYHQNTTIVKVLTSCLTVDKTVMAIGSMRFLFVFLAIMSQRFI